MSEDYSVTEGAPRVAPLTGDALDQAAAEYHIPQFQASLSVFQVLLNHPALARAMNNLGTTLLVGGKPPDGVRAQPKMDARLRELMIMRIAWLSGSAYEWAQHWVIAKQVGLPEDEIAAVRDWRSHGGFGREESAVLAAVDETFEAGTISDATFAELADFLDEGTLVEAVVIIGHWRMFATVLRSLRVPLESGMPGWAPDGVAPI